MSIFVTMGAVILAGIRSGVVATGRLRFEARARNLAITALSELQMGQLALRDDGPNSYEDESLDGWTWQVVVSDPQLGWQGPPLKQVEIVIANTDMDYIYRLGQLVQDDQEQEQEQADASEEEAPE